MLLAISPMLRFFRSIRQNLLKQGKVSRYIGYARGEIVLIMVGIFLALQLNNWKDERLDRIEELEKRVLLISEDSLYWTKMQKVSLEAVLDSELKQHVTAALNRTLLMEVNWKLARDQARELVTEIGTGLNE